MVRFHFYFYFLFSEERKAYLSRFFLEICSLLSSALIADQTGSYVYSFFTTGGVPLTASLIPIILIFINRGKFKVHPRSMGVEEAKEEKVNTVSKEVQTEQCTNLE